MFDTLMRSGPPLSRGLIAWLAGLSALCYSGLFMAGKSFLPEFLFRDSDKIQAQMNGSSAYDGSSFDAVGKFYAMFGPTLLNVVVLALGVGFILAIFKRVRHVGSLGVALVFGAPCVFFNLFVASKDTLVVALSLLIVWTLRRGGAKLTMAAVLFGYASYAVSVRTYYLLIVALAGCLWIYRRAGRRTRLVMIGAGLLGLYALPTIGYYALLHPRDMAVDYLVYQSPFGARTSFYNLRPPDGFSSFCIDYAYAALRLHLPMLFSPDPRGLVMQMFVLAAWFSTRPMRANRETWPGVSVLACLVMAHMMVSTLFEPDLGSYVRHLSSVSLFCMVLFSLRNNASLEAGATVQGVPEAAAPK
ncbi:hypothetical protein [Caballeronia sp. ATUFL_M2_KS44]|uniref:hypothetical protein n=1 Tax=Caballeronia sp. ATUFL_M2_KS44 TaxID=2921767 RepID=UPI002028C6E3|nr:hypothetical protein [Caballeronia sp. ATUFL_M2_KS44]